jgi:type IV secretory pathway TraG/TraD family ATPase VirD4
VLGFQDLAQLRDVYGADDAKTMSAVLGTKVLFRIADPETARWGADALGEVEEETVKESTRYDAAGDTPKGVQLSAQRVQRHLVMPAELLRQERFHCFVQLSGAWPVAQTTLPHPNTVQRQPIARPVEPAKPEETFAARVADVPDTPPADAEKGDSSTEEAVLPESQAATSATPASSGEAGAGPASSTTNAPAITPPASPAEAIKGKE